MGRLPNVSLPQTGFVGQSDIFRWKGASTNSLPAWIVSPPVLLNPKPFILVHGISRETEEMAHLMSGAAALAGRMIILPHFCKSKFPRYQLCLERARPDLALLDLADQLSSREIFETGQFDLGGFSGGAQFAHRFTWFYPHKVGQLSVSSAGWYTFPDSSPFPYGMDGAQSKRLPLKNALNINLHKFLSRKFVIRVGALDNVVDANTRSGAEINRQQGKDRVTRAKRWAESLRDSAIQLGIAPKVDFAVLPDCGHRFSNCVANASLHYDFLNLNKN